MSVDKSDKFYSYFGGLRVKWLITNWYQHIFIDKKKKN